MVPQRQRLPAVPARVLQILMMRRELMAPAALRRESPGLATGATVRDTAEADAEDSDGTISDGAEQDQAASTRRPVAQPRVGLRRLCLSKRGSRLRPLAWRWLKRRQRWSLGRRRRAPRWPEWCGIAVRMASSGWPAMAFSTAGQREHSKAESDRSPSSLPVTAESQRQGLGARPVDVACHARDAQPQTAQRGLGVRAKAGPAQAEKHVDEVVFGQQGMVATAPGL